MAGCSTFLRYPAGSSIRLLFIARFSEEFLVTAGISPEEVLPVPSILPGMKATVRSLLPADYWDSVYSRYWRGETFGEGYDEIAGAVNRILEWLRPQDGPSFSYLYIPHIDHVSHEHGPNSPETLAMATAIRPMTIGCPNSDCRPFRDIRDTLSI
jgi:hypothetical protein